MKLLPKKISKFNININPILQNPIILYFVTFLVIVDMFLLLNEKDIFSFIIFVLLGLLTSFFSKNMIVIFVVSLTFTHIIKYGNSAYINEGFENDTSQTSESNVDDKNNKNSDDASKKESSKSTTKEDKIEYADLKNEYKDFQGIQDKIVGALKDIDPLLSRAEIFIQKFEKYKKQKESEISDSSSK